MIRRLLDRVLGRKTAKPRHTGPRIIPASRHGIRRDALSPCALKVTDTLQDAGYQGFIVGGAVRDLLLGRAPKDFDVATDATPEQVRQLFRRSRIIGRRFQIVHVMCGRETIEVTTFRAAGNPEGEEGESRPTDEHGRLLSDNVFGSQEGDAARRDFTVNALYYDPAKGEIWDNHGGVADCEKRVLRMIGDPEARYREDPVRMLRAARFAAKLGFEIDRATQAPVARLADLLQNVPRARLMDEMLKVLMSGHALDGVHKLREEGLHRGLLPLLDDLLEDEAGARFINAALSDTDARVREDRSASPAFLFAALLWPRVNSLWRERVEQGETPTPALFAAMDEVLDTQRERLAIPRRHDGMIKEIWSLQPRFEQRSGSRPMRLLEHPRYRASWDFLQLRGKGGEIDPALAAWWETFQMASDEDRAAMLMPDSGGPAKRRRRRRKPGATAAASEGGGAEHEPA
jgi:poly(A) polymerase